jgi:WD40 repeat protein
MAVAGADCAIVTLKLRNLTLDVTLPRAAQQAVDSRAASCQTDVVAVAMSQSQNHVVGLYADHSIRCWELRHRGAPVLSWTLLTHAKCIWALACQRSPTGAHRLATASEDGTVRTWKLGDGHSKPSVQPEGTIKLASETQWQSSLPSAQPSSQVIVPRALAWSPCGCFLAIGDHTGMVHVYDTMSHACVKAWPAHEGLVRCLSFSERPVGDTTLLATAGDDGLIHIYDASHQKYTVLQTLDEHVGMGVTAVAFTDGSGIVSCAQDCKIVFRCAGALLLMCCRIVTRHSYRLFCCDCSILIFLLSCMIGPCEGTVNACRSRVNCVLWLVLPS